MSQKRGDTTPGNQDTGRGHSAGTFSRRTVLSQLVVLAGVGAVGLGGCRSGDHTALVAALVELCPDRKAATAIGETFLEETSTNRERLASRLALELDWHPALDRATLTTRLLERIQHDFRDGRTLRVDAWILAQTEVWWAALVALA